MRKILVPVDGRSVLSKRCGMSALSLETPAVEISWPRTAALTRRTAFVSIAPADLWDEAGGDDTARDLLDRGRILQRHILSDRPHRSSRVRARSALLLVVMGTGSARSRLVLGSVSARRYT